jgi:hypothetical protein
VTLVYAARDPEHNNAVVLRELLQASRPDGDGLQKAAAAARSAKTATSRTPATQRGTPEPQAGGRSGSVLSRSQAA